MAGRYDGVQVDQASGARVQGSNARRQVLMTADLRMVPADLRHDWRCAAPRQLRAAEPARGSPRVCSDTFPRTRRNLLWTRHRLERAREPAGRAFLGSADPGIPLGWKSSPRGPRLASMAFIWTSGRSTVRPPPRGSGYLE